MGLVPDVLLDYISVNTYWTILFTCHALLAVALLGALTHQAASVLMPVRQTAMLPESMIRKIPLSLVWILPLAAIPILIYALRFFWRWE